MDLLTETMRVINGNVCDVPLPDGWGIVLPVPGLEKGCKVSRTFASPMSLRNPLIGRPMVRYALDLNSRSIVHAYEVDVFQDHAPVLLDTTLPGVREGIIRYTEAYPRLYKLAFQAERGTDDYIFCLETVRAFESAAGGLMDFYRWLSPEFFSWLVSGEPVS